MKSRCVGLVWLLLHRETSPSGDLSIIDSVVGLSLCRPTSHKEVGMLARRSIIGSVRTRTGSMARAYSSGSFVRHTEGNACSRDIVYESIYGN